MDKVGSGRESLVGEQEKVSTRGKKVGDTYSCTIQRKENEGRGTNNNSPIIL